MRPVLLGLAALLVAVPAAAARSFELSAGTGDIAFSAGDDADATLAIDRVGRGARILGPASTAWITCADDRPLQHCVRMRRTERGTEWIVRRPVSIWHHGDAGFSIEVRGASSLRNVLVSGCGTVTLRGTGTYSADGADAVSYTPGRRVVVKLVP